MSWEAELVPLGPAKALVQCGPMHMTVEAWTDGRPSKDAVGAAVRAALQGLTEIARFQPLCKSWIDEAAPSPLLPDPVNTMLRAAASACETKVTGMAAVAGTIAETAAEAGFRAGATRIICNNGGDIALRLAPGEYVTVGVSSSLEQRKPWARIKIGAGSGIRGICTSGLGGRSLTLGIASAVTVFAENAPDADVAATLIANHVSARHPAIVRKHAEELRPDTDIGGLLVTERVGSLPESVWHDALANGVKEARRLQSLGLIKGAALHAGGYRAVLAEDIPELEEMK